MSTDNWTSTAALANPTTENVLVQDVTPGDVIYVTTEADSNPYLVRVRHVDKFPDNVFNLHGTPALLLNRATTQRVGTFDGDAWVKRVVL